MYLALLPDEESLAALKRFAPSLPSDAHVTIIHSKHATSGAMRSLICKDLTVPKWAGSLMLDTGPVRIFGGLRRVFGLRLPLCSELQDIRIQAESILHKTGLRWSREWPFLPHITLGSSPPKTPPVTLRFDRMEWR